MHEDTGQLVLCRQAQKGIQVPLLGVHTTVGDETKEMESAVLLRSKFNGLDQRGVLEEAAIGDGAVDPADIHADDASGSEVQMPHLGVSHLTVGKPDEVIAGMNQRVGKLFEKTVVVRLASQGDGVAVSIRAIAPAIENSQNERFVSHC